MKNTLSFYAWGEGLASMMGMYAPVAKKVQVLKLHCGDYAYTVRVQGHFREEPATGNYLLIPKDKNQYFTIVCHSYGMCEDETLAHPACHHLHPEVAYTVDRGPGCEQPGPFPFPAEQS